MNLQELRQKYPEYNDLSDKQLADSYHQKYYSDLPIQDFYSRIGYSSQEEPLEESFASKLPRNIMAGLAQGGHGLLNTPYDLAKSAEKFGEELGGNINKQLHMEKYVGKQGRKPGYLESLVNQFNKSANVPQSMINPDWNKSFAEHIPHQQEMDFAQMLGQKGAPTTSDYAIQKLAQYAPEILGGISAYRELPIALTRRGASKELRQAQKLAGERNISALDIPSEILEDIPQFLPSTKPYQRSLEEAKTGNYDPLFSLQSDLGKAATGFSKNPFSFAERRHGQEAGKIRNQLLEAFRSELEKHGHHDIAELMKKGQKRYANYMRIKPFKKYGYGLAASQTPYGKKLLNALGIL